MVTPLIVLALKAPSVVETDAVSAGIGDNPEQLLVPVRAVVFAMAKTHG
jgi:hypothetical protein